MNFHSCNWEGNGLCQIQKGETRTKQTEVVTLRWKELVKNFREEEQIMLGKELWMGCLSVFGKALSTERYSLVMSGACLKVIHGPLKSTQLVRQLFSIVWEPL